MFEELLKYPETRSFLSDYPKARWSICMESVFIYGLYCMKRDFPNGLSIPELLKISGKDILNPPKTQKSDGNTLFSPDPKDPSSPFQKSLKNCSSQTVRKSFIKDTFDSPQTSERSEQGLQDIKSKSSKTRDFKTLDPLKANSYSNRSKPTKFIQTSSENFDFLRNSLSEPKTCPLENAKVLLRGDTNDSKSLDFQTRLQKQGLRRKVFPVLDIKLEDSLNSSNFSLASSKF
jgi:hypothetical protein